MESLKIIIKQLAYQMVVDTERELDDIYSPSTWSIAAVNMAYSEGYINGAQIRR